ncbi:MAG: hypothetical protein WBC91_19800 [Phototrophicaceae bacterium]
MIAPNRFDLNGRVLESALNEVPRLSLDFYSYGCIMRKCDNGLMSEYPVDLQQVATSLAREISFDTGILNHEILMIRQTGLKKLVVAYRKRQKTGIWMEGTQDALRVPLPDLVMSRLTQDNQNPQYTVYAVKGRPTSLSAKLFNCPLPNVFNSGSICWGTVKRVSADQLSDASLDKDFGMLLGSPFGTHACTGKSEAHPQDIRDQLIALEKRGARVYPRKDLISANKILADIVGEK